MLTIPWNKTYSLNSIGSVKSIGRMLCIAGNRQYLQTSSHEHGSSGVITPFLIHCTSYTPRMLSTALLPSRRRSLIKQSNGIHWKKMSTWNKLPIIYLFTKDGCTLCDEAKEVLRPHMHRFILEEVDITLPENKKWYDLYKYDIPVFHIYEDFLFQHRVDLDALEKGLEKYKDGYYSQK